MQIESSLAKKEYLDLIQEFTTVCINPENAENNDQIVIDDGSYDFIFIIKGTLTIKYDTDNSITFKEKVCTIHQLKPPYRLQLTKELELFIIKVQPWCNSTLFPLNKETGQINLANTYSNRIIDLHKHISNASEKETKIKLAYEFINSIQLNPSTEMKLIKSICYRIMEKNGTIKVNTLSEDYKINRQQLNIIFKKYVHYSLKQYLRIIRIKSIIQFKIQHPETKLTEAAYLFDYTDQAHFINDFKKVCGITPLKFFKQLPIFFHRHKG